MSVDACIEEYKILADDIFGHPRMACIRGPIPWLRDKYDGRTIQRAVQSVVSRRTTDDQRNMQVANFNTMPGLCRT